MKVSMSKDQCADMSSDEEPLSKLFDDAMKIFEAIEKSNEPTNSNITQVCSFLNLFLCFIIVRILCEQQCSFILLWTLH